MKHPNSRIQIDHATWFSEGTQHQGTLFIEGDRIVAIDQEPEAFEADEHIDASGLLMFPGFVDCFAYMPEPGFVDKGTIDSETRAAAMAGFTTVLCSPETHPVLDSTALVHRVHEQAHRSGHTDLKVIGAMTQKLEGQQLSNMHALHQSGCLALSQGFQPFETLNVMRRAFEYAATFDLLFVSVPWCADLANQGCAHEGALSGRLGLNGVPEVAETLAVAQQLLLAEATGLRLHFTGITTARSVELIQAAIARGVDVTADTSLAHLLFTDQQLLGFDSRYHIQPPLRTETDRQALMAAVKAGELMLSSHHCSQDIASKATPFAASEPGMSQYDSLPAALTHLVEQGIDWHALQKALCLAPRQRFGLESTGIQINAKADLCFIDPSHEWHYNRENAASTGTNHPWFEQPLVGRNRLTLKSGRIVHQELR